MMQQFALWASLEYLERYRRVAEWLTWSSGFPELEWRHSLFLQLNFSLFY